MTITNIALIGDYNPDVTAHQAIPKALEIAGESLQQSVSHKWIHTSELTGDVSEKLGNFSGVWGVPASPFENWQGALSAIQHARENSIAFLGTCGGYQHAFLEFARDVLDLKDANNSEDNPDATFPLTSALSCSLIEQDGEITLHKNSVAAKLYGKTKIAEKYHCSYGFNPAYINLFNDSDLKITGIDADGDPRVFEVSNHPFFIGTAYQPERSALQYEQHPLITAFVEHAANIIS